MSEPLDAFTRQALAATAVMNIAGSAAFTPLGAGLRAAVGMPDAHPVWLLTVGSFILIFGFGYATLAFTGRPDRTFLAVGAAGKATFALLLAAMGLAGEIPLLVATAGLPDLVFAAIFTRWLVRTAP
jgi:hypothetical protein